MRVHFGGPDRPEGALAALLKSRIEAVPPDGEIHWIAYYFGNAELAQSLLDANRRGVRVSVDVDARPRRAEVNIDVLRQLRGPEGLANGVRALTHLQPCHVHEKVYFFSHPQPHVYTGSYNPSGTAGLSPELLQDIGDQDRGHNFLVEITDPAAVSFLRSHLHDMHSLPHGILERFSSRLNATYDAPELSICFFPRINSRVHVDVLRRIPFEHIRVAASHFRDRSTAHLLAKLAARGAMVEVLAHDTLRRVPAGVEQMLTAAGVRFIRYSHPEGLPMHNKFMLLEGRGEHWVLFGSFNLTRTSRWLNHELLLRSSDRDLFAAFDKRWDEMIAEVTKQSVAA